VITEGICVYILSDNDIFKNGKKYQYTEKNGFFSIYINGNIILSDIFGSQFNDAFKKSEDIREEKIRMILDEWWCRMDHIYK
jgi:hypothetical protein